MMTEAARRELKAGGLVPNTFTAAEYTEENNGEPLNPAVLALNPGESTTVDLGAGGRVTFTCVALGEYVDGTWVNHVVSYCRGRDDGGPCVFTPDEEYAQKSREPAPVCCTFCGDEPKILLDVKEFEGFSGEGDVETPRLRAKKPRLTDRMLRGIVAATSQVLAGPADGECEDDWGDIQAADTWAKQMIDYREGRKVR